jgi:hypothetical protein
MTSASIPDGGVAVVLSGAVAKGAFSVGAIGAFAARGWPIRRIAATSSGADRSRASTSAQRSHLARARPRMRRRWAAPRGHRSTSGATVRDDRQEARAPAVGVAQCPPLVSDYAPRRLFASSIVATFRCPSRRARNAARWRRRKTRQPAILGSCGYTFWARSSSDAAGASWLQPMAAPRGQTTRLAPPTPLRLARPKAATTLLVVPSTPERSSWSVRPALPRSTPRAPRPDRGAPTTRAGGC